ncbi:MAG: UDP-glucose--hexose-1-phosphate uridylyltransferase [Candidatus Marinimicrobia bacterium]|nr:UDP-glucose--hexose-1-phosphate uridylyltransferase [Candidatus Neomarinimicrobiota bacterium]
MTSFNFDDHPHRRLNPLTGDWVQVSPHRAKRPWQGQEEDAPQNTRPKYDPDCYLCPGNTRAGGEQNEEYGSTFVFTNDFASLKLDTPEANVDEDDLLIAQGEQGTCRVICFSPRHDLTLPEMEVSQVEEVVDLWTDEYRQLGGRENINYVQIFENKGQIMGCSNPHPHGQIWAQKTNPDEPAKELVNQREYMESHDSCLLCDYLGLEQEKNRRIVVENEHFAVLVPFWAVWPFEVLLVSKRHLGSFLEMDKIEKSALAEVIRQITIRYDNVFNTSFPYSAGFHPMPTDGEEHPEWHFHMHYYPPLLRSATVKKFMVGYEMLANPQRDITAEAAAERLRDVPATHYTRRV